MIETLGFAGVFVTTVVAIPAFIRAAPGLGLMDAAEGRKTHDGEVPLIGGIVMGVVFLGGYLAIALAGPHQARFGLAVAISIILIGGMLDDLHELRSLAKFGFQIAASAALIYLDGTVLVQLGQLLTERVFTLGGWSVPLTVFAVVGVMNAFNMADGIDGLAGLLSFLAFVTFGVFAAVIGESAVFVVCGLAGGVTLGFLCFNMRTPTRPKAIVFMGDTGSQFLGLLLAWCAIRLHNAQPPAINAVTAGWILGIVLGDALCVMIRRALRGRSPFTGDREHLHHLLMGFGLSVQKTVAIIAFASAAAGAFAYWAEQAGVPAHVMFYLYLVLLAIHCLVAESIFRKHSMRMNSAAPS